MDEPRLPDSRRGLFLYWGGGAYPGRGLLAIFPWKERA